MNEERDILIARFEENILDQNGNSFITNKEVEFLEDAIVGKYIRIPDGGQLSIENAEFALGLNDFTLDFWVKITGNYAVVSTMPMTGCGLGIWTNFDKRYYIGQGKGGGNTSSIGISYNNSDEWIHYAIVRKAGRLYGFVNGKLDGITNSSSYNVSNTTLHVNGLYSNSWLGGSNCYKNIRFSNYARWTEDFIPPDPSEELPGPEPAPIDMKLHILLKVNQKVNLTGYMWPVGNNPPNLIWSSEDATIASVDQNGTVTANAVGKTKIYVQNDDGSFKAFARIKVIEEGEDELLLSILLEIGEECILVPEFDPEEAETAVLWSSSNNTVATVNPVGKITGIAQGLAIITAQTADGKLTDSMYVTVKPQD